MEPLLLQSRRFSRSNWTGANFSILLWLFLPFLSLSAIETFLRAAPSNREKEREKDAPLFDELKILLRLKLQAKRAEKLLFMPATKEDTGQICRGEITARC